MKCSNCDHLVPDGEKFCTNCGQKIESKSESNQNTKYCSNCGESMEKDSQFCTNCGYSTNGESNHNINNNPSSNFLSGKYDKIIYLGYGLTIASLIFGFYAVGWLFTFGTMAIGAYILTRHDIKKISTNKGSMIINPTEYAYTHGKLLVVLPVVLPVLVALTLILFLNAL